MSHQIRALEEQIGLALFVRRTRAVELTDAGARLALATRGAFQQIEDALGVIVDAERVLSVSTTPAFAALWLVPRLAAFERIAPGTRVRIDATTAPVNLERDRRIDVAVRYGAPTGARPRSRPLVQERLGAWGVPRHLQQLGAFGDAALLETEWQYAELPKRTWTMGGRSNMSLASAAEHPWALERELVLARVFDAPRALVYRMWTDPEHVMKWFGPQGYSCTLHEMAVRVGGRWRFDMTAPNGTVYPNRIEYLEIVPNERLVFDHGTDIDDDPARFRVTITFDEQADQKTVVTLRQLHPTKEQRDAKLGFGAVELGYQTMEKLAAYLRAQP